MEQPQEDRSKFLRHRAEESLRGNLVDLEGLQTEDIQTLIHELQVHQVELTLQNEELRRVQLELEESRDQYSDLYNYAPAGYCTLSRKDQILEANNTLADLIGISQENLINRKLSDFVWPDDQDQYYLHRRQAFHVGHQVIEIRMAKRTGEKVCVRLESKLDHTDKNRLRVVLSDITGQKQVEEARRASEERLQIAITGAKIGIWDWDLVTGEIIFNDLCKALFGLPVDADISFGVILNTIHPADRGIKEQHLMEMRSGQGLTESEYRVVWPDGSLHWILDAGRCFVDPEGNPVRMTGIAMNITRQKQYEEQIKENATELEKLNRELKDFTSIASHDLQEPLRKIRSFGDRLINRSDKSLQLSEQEQDFIERMQDAARRMQSMIDGLLALSRVTVKPQHHMPVDLSQLTREVLSDLENLIERSGGEVEVSDLGVIEADPLLMRQLFQNLIGNALKFRKPGVPPRVRIYKKTHPQGDSGQGDSGAEFVDIYVEDNGIGMNMAYGGRLFKPFSRLVGHSEYEGNGIGLAICHKIVEQHEGSISVKSTQGEGSIFIVTLPVKQLNEIPA